MATSLAFAGLVRRCSTSALVFTMLATSAPDRSAASARATEIAAGPCGIWSQVATPVHPSARTNSAAIYDPVRMRMILFGGGGTTELWEYVSGSGWSPLAPAGSPPAPNAPLRAVYDPVRDRMLLLAADRTLWSLSLAGPPVWSSLSTTVVPTSTGTLIHDPVADRLLLVGDQLWSLDLASPTPDWSDLGVVSPTGVRNEDAVYDSHRHRIVVLVTRWGFAPHLYALPLTTLIWGELHSLNGLPPWSESGEAIYDEARDRLIRYGGITDQTSGSADYETWAVYFEDGPVIVDLMPIVKTPGARYQHSMVYDNHRQELVMFGGVDYRGHGGNTRDETWNLPLGVRADAVAAPGQGGTVTRDTNLPCNPPLSTVTFTATPASGWSFVFWSGDVSGTQNPLAVVMDDWKLVIANFRSNTSVEDVPAAALAIENVVWDASGRSGTVTFALPHAGDAAIEIFDLAGRRWLRHSVERLAAGRHVARLEGPTALGSGVHFVRVSQGSVSATRRLVIAR